MSENSAIEWTDATWNPVTGCSKVSQGCKNCYALREWPRISANRQTVYYGREFTDVRRHPERLGQPWHWAKGRRIFVNSMSDLFHESVPFEFIACVFHIMSVTTRHTYQILTKRPKRMLEFFDWVRVSKDDEGEVILEPDNWHMGGRISEVAFATPAIEALGWTPQHNPRQGGYDNCGPSWPYENVWLGVSLEDQATADERIPLLLSAPAALRFLSCEPLLSTVELHSYLAPGRRHWSGCESFARCECGPQTIGLGSRSIDWVIVGGESGPGARPFDIQWARDILDSCRRANVPAFCKQFGAHVITSGVQEPAQQWPMQTGLIDTGLGHFRKHLADRKGGDMAEWPEDLRVRQFPEVA